MLTALGSGLASVLYGGVFTPLGLSWRWLYVVALPPLFLVAILRRRLPESHRFTAAATEGRLASHWHEILKPPHRQWIVLVCLTALLGALATQAGVFTIDFLQEDRHMGPTAANFILVGSGAAAIPFLVGSGALSDRFGRKAVGCAFGLLSVVGGFAFYFVARGAWQLFFALLVLFIGTFGSWPTLGAFGSELFPTAHRALASSWSSVARVTGQSLSFVLGGALIDWTGELSRAAIILGLGPLIAFGLIWVLFPETKGRELEDISEAHVPITPPFVP